MGKFSDADLEDYQEWVELFKMAREAGITPQEIRLYFGWAPLLEEREDELSKK